MIFGIMNIANFAHGELYALGACLVLFITVKLQIDFLIALPTAVVAAIAFGYCSSAQYFAGCATNRGYRACSLRSVSR